MSLPEPAEDDLRPTGGHRRSGQPYIQPTAGVRARPLGIGRMVAGLRVQAGMSINGERKRERLRY